MKSKFAEKFNHDEDAPGYDEDVLNENNPVRAGYSDLLDWVAKASSVRNNYRILELGSGTGNLSSRLQPCKQLTCVDISQVMLSRAGHKLQKFSNIIYIREDLLEYCTSCRETFDVIVSTYTIHHLIEEEKAFLFKRIKHILNPAGKAVFGDLMFRDQKHRKSLLEQYRQSGQAELADDIEDEFYWDLGWAVEELKKNGLIVDVKQFSELSWGIIVNPDNALKC